MRAAVSAALASHLLEVATVLCCWPAGLLQQFRSRARTLEACPGPSPVRLAPNMGRARTSPYEPEECWQRICGVLSVRATRVGSHRRWQTGKSSGKACSRSGLKRLTMTAAKYVTRSACVLASRVHSSGVLSLRPHKVQQMLPTRRERGRTGAKACFNADGEGPCASGSMSRVRSWAVRIVSSGRGVAAAAAAANPSDKLKCKQPGMLLPSSFGLPTWLLA